MIAAALWFVAAVVVVTAAICLYGWALDWLDDYAATSGTDTTDNRGE